MSSFSGDETDSCIPGRIYFNDYLVPIRSSDEAYVLDLLRTARPATPEQADYLMGGAHRIISFVTSSEYIARAQTTMADPGSA
jgi:hypothetical protein